MAYEERIYRSQMKAEDLEYFQVLEFESDLFIGIARNASQPMIAELVLKEVQRLRKAIAVYDQQHPNFIESLLPLASDRLAQPIIADMLEAGIKTGVGPMAAVAGAVSKYVGKILEPYSEEIIVENGGDLLIKTKKVRRIALHTGNSQFPGLSLKIKPAEKAMGICTSSGVMGHSLSFGKADAVTVLSEDVPLADAAATALGNRIKKPEDVARGIEWVKKIPGITGALILIEDQLGAWGAIELC